MALGPQFPNFSTYSVTCDVKVMEKVSEFLLFNIEEKSVVLEIGRTYIHLPVQIKQLKDWPGMAVHKVVFQMVLMCQQYANQHIELVKTNLSYSCPVQEVKYHPDL